MTEALVTSPELDRLAERVEQQLLTQQQQSGSQHAQIERELADLRVRLQGQDPAALLGELAALKKEQREWQAERRDVAARIEAISAKLERLE
jgi:hypothetical protein